MLFKIRLDENEINKPEFYHLYTSYIFIYLLAFIIIYKVRFNFKVFLLYWRFINRLLRKFPTNYKQKSI
jgi:hypothetical protein